MYVSAALSECEGSLKSLGVGFAVQAWEGVKYPWGIHEGDELCPDTSEKTWRESEKSGRLEVWCEVSSSNQL